MTAAAGPLRAVSRAVSGLGESPLWHPAEARLYWVDIPGRTLWRLDPATGEEWSWTLPEEPGCLGLVAEASPPGAAAQDASAPNASAAARTAAAGGAAAANDGPAAAPGRLVIAMRDGFHHAVVDDRAITLRRIAPASYDTSRFRFNDGKVDPQGRFWAGTLFEPKTLAAAGLYCLEAGRARAVTGPEAGEFPWSQWGVTTSNGLAFSPDGRTMYHSDTPAHVVYAYDRDPASGRPLNRRIWWQTDGDKTRPDYGGRPDGAAVDAAGCYWSAMYEGGRIVQLSPSGELLQSVPVPARCPTMVAFGGADRSTLFVTTARAGRSADELARHPDSGRVFALRVPVAGLAAGVYRG